MERAEFFFGNGIMVSLCFFIRFHYSSLLFRGSILEYHVNARDVPNDCFQNQQVPR